MPLHISYTSILLWQLYYVDLNYLKPGGVLRNEDGKRRQIKCVSYETGFALCVK